MAFYLPLVIIFAVVQSFLLIAVLPGLTTVYWIAHLVALVLGLLYFENAGILRRKISTENFCRSGLFYSLLLGLVTMGFFYFQSRFKINPIGMWDAWAMWNLKAVHIYRDYTMGNALDFGKEIFPHKDYPISVPLLTAGVFILSSSSDLIRIWVMNFFVFSVILYILLSTAKLERISQLGSAIIIAIFLVCNIGFMHIATDLCADHILSLSLLMILYSWDHRKNPKNNFLLIGFSLCLPLWIKNEGVIFCAVGILWFILCTRQELNLSKTLRIVSPAIFSYILLSVFRSQIPNVKNEDFRVDITKLMDFSHLEIVFWKLKDAFVSFHFGENSGFYLAISLVLLVWGNRFLRYSMLFLLSITAIYNGIYFFSTANLDWHLQTSYNRIHTVFLPGFVYLFLRFVNQQYPNFLKIIGFKVSKNYT